MALPAVLNADSVAALQQQLHAQMQSLPSGAAWVLEAGGVERFDSAGLALLLACRRAAQARGQSMHVHGWPQGLQSLARVYGVLPLLAPELVDAAAATEL